MKKALLLPVIILLSMAFLASCNLFRKSIAEQRVSQHYDVQSLTADSLRWYRAIVESSYINIVHEYTPLQPDGTPDSGKYVETWHVKKLTEQRDTTDACKSTEIALQSLEVDSVYNCSSKEAIVQPARNFGFRLGILLACILMLAGVYVYRQVTR